MIVLSAREKTRLEGMFFLENELRGEGYLKIAGVDEAGRGPLAGPVFAAACILPEGALFEHLNDSKQLSGDRRKLLFSQITVFPGVIFGVGQASVEEIDERNILRASLLAMQRAVRALSEKPDYLLVDGNHLPRGKIPAKAVIRGDSLSLSIAAASVVAKVLRDQIMEKYDRQWPQFGFKRHKGYATAEHLEALQKWGPCPLHRKSFEPISLLRQTKDQLTCP